LTFLINLSLETGDVTPLYKSGSLAETGNYRRISILFTFSKILAYLECRSLLLEYQFGFRPNRSTELAAAYFTDFTRKEADSGKATEAVLIDLSKAFDTLISHSVL